ncbi:ABC transporter ATP-binding protein [Effusibacillus lacus]|uniref:Molybdenum ABC transporter ATP-binding protein n=1 Tax=Effusibacillus lacus TaxID=1348429 RepID=A0A292YBU6_9BACL|nr:ABC transporter ATP-binding protein [Effusibacillus lacus]TCS74599.1 iron complex transport system ATP-binding protein [Effusibacillus lacus]GAX88472.1 molybdenum ABC transporter ATP-binding protein [Effusibacillus lacus]
MKVIEIEGVSWTRNDKPILKQVDWTLQAGEHWAIIGLNGSGKTSLLKMITGYEWPSRGSIRVLGHTYGRCEIREVRKKIGWVSSALRDEMYPSDTALEVVISGKFASIGLWDQTSEVDRDKAGNLLERFGMARLKDERFGTLSQGEKQKVLLARALMAEPKLLILDEPCFGLDIKAREEVLTDLEQTGRLEQAPTMLYVTHHIEEIQPVFTHALVLRDGEVIAAGEKHRTLTSANLRDAFGIDVQVEWSDDRPWIKVGNRVE